MYTRGRVCVCLSLCVRVSICVHVYTHVGVCMLTFMLACGIHICACACVCACVRVPPISPTTRMQLRVHNLSDHVAHFCLTLHSIQKQLEKVKSCSLERVEFLKVFRIPEAIILLAFLKERERKGATAVISSIDS